MELVACLGYDELVWMSTVPTAGQFGVGFYRGAGIFGGRLDIPIHNGR